MITWDQLQWREISPASRWAELALPHMGIKLIKVWVDVWPDNTVTVLFEVWRHASAEYPRATRSMYDLVEAALYLMSLQVTPEVSE